MRVAQPGGFQNSAYWAVRHDYDPDKLEAACGDGTTPKACPLSARLMPLSDLDALGMGPAPYDLWRYNDAASRVGAWASPNTGDIVLISNSRYQFQFGAAYRGQHGDLSFADSLVPVAFGFPGASGDKNEDTLLAPIRDYFAEAGEVSLADPAIRFDRRMLEAEAMRAFFLLRLGSQ